VRPRKRELTPEEAEKRTRILYWWLLVVIFFEYARPAAYFAPMRILPLNSLLPLSLLMVTFFARGLRPWTKIFEDSLTKWLFIYVGAVFLSMMWASVQMYAFNIFKTVLGYLFIFIMIARIVTTRQRLYGVFGTLIVAHLFLIVMNPAIVLNPAERNYIVGGTFLGDGNDFALSLCILLGLSVQLANAAESKRKKIFYWGVLGILVLAVIGTQSRGGTLGMAAVFGYLWWRSPRKGLGVLAIGIAVVGILLYAPDVYFERMRTIVNPQQESSAEGRLQAWRAGINMALDNALGVGAGNFPHAFPKYRSATAPVRWMTAHSMYFLILGELGFLGLLLLLRLVFGNALANAKLRERIAQEQIDPAQRDASIRLLNNTNASVAGFAVAGAFLSVAYYPHVFVLGALLLCARSMVAESAGLSLATAKARLPARRRALAHEGEARPVQSFSSSRRAASR